MTPDDVAAIRARYGNPHSGDIRALCDALEQAWSWHERDSDDLDRMRERAERAEAKASVATEALRYLGARADVMAAALARVQALCDDVYETRSTHPFASTVEIRNAIEGDNE